MAKAQSFVKDFVISLNPISMSGSLFTVRRTGSAQETALVSICPECENTPTVLKQFYGNGPCGHGPYTLSDLSKAKKVNGKLVKVGQAEAAAAKESPLPLNLLDLSVHPRDTMEAITYPSTKAYIFIPSVVTQPYGVLVNIINSSPFAFVGISNIKHSETLVRLVAWRGFLILQQILYPEDVSEVEVPEDISTEEFITTMEQFIEKTAKPFEKEDYKNDTKIRLELLVKAMSAGESVPIPVEKKTGDDVALANLKALLAG